MNNRDLISELKDNIFIITLNRLSKHNAFDNHLLQALLTTITEAINNPKARVILLKANGKYFSAGADLHLMQKMVDSNFKDNVNDALILAKVLYLIYNSPKPTIAMVQGSAFGGGLGLIAASDIVIATHDLKFCFSEVKLGLIPAVISPYVIKVMGEKSARWLFLSADTINSEQAKNLHLIQYLVEKDNLWPFSLGYAQRIASLPPEAVQDCKKLITQIAGQPINDQLMNDTAILLAEKRISPEGQAGLKNFLAPH